MNVARATKAVIPAAGRGTRLMPLTKVLPKALMPVADRPALHHLMEELMAAGISEACVIHDVRDPIPRHFAPDDSLEARCDENGVGPGLAGLQRLRQQLRLTFVDGDAEQPAWSLGRVREFVGSDPFVLALPDELVAPEAGLLREMLDASVALQASVAAFRGGTNTPRVLRIDGRPVLRRPLEAAEHGAPCLIGRFVVRPEVLDELDAHGGPFEFLDMLGDHARRGMVIGLRYDGRFWDIGSLDGYIAAFVALAES